MPFVHYQTFLTTGILPSVQTWTDVAFSNGYYVAIAGQSNVAATSADGRTWTQRTLPSTKSWQAISAGASGQFVAIATATADTAYSNDNGFTWSAGAALPNSTFDDLAYDGSTFAAIGGNPSGFRAALGNATTSWTGKTGVGTSTYNAIAFGDGVYRATGNSGYVAASNDLGVTWSNTNSLASSGWTGIAYGSQTMVAVRGVASTTDKYAYTTSATSYNTWTKVTGSNTDVMTDIAYGAGLFVATTNTNRVHTSPDGITWTVRNIPFSANWSCITYGSSGFVALAQDSNQAILSTDGITWS